MEPADAKLTDLLADFLVLTSRTLPDDVRDKLKQLRAEETNPLASQIYDAMFENLRLAEETGRPCCQDTGALQFFLRAGAQFPLLATLEQDLQEAVRRATRMAPLQHNAVEIFDEQNTGDNVGHRLPSIYWDIVPGDGLTLTAYMAGGGCTLPGFAKVLMPAQGYEGVVDAVLEQLVQWGVNACPPLLVGIGIATATDAAALLSKQALMRPLGSRSSHPLAAKLELELEQRIDGMGMGPQGLGGSASVLGVHIEHGARHPSGIAVALSTGCWAHRRSTIQIGRDLAHTILAHREVNL